MILIIDDNTALAEQYAYDLERVGGFDTLAAGGGREALEIVAREPVDCMLLDLEMPGMDGFDVLRALDERKIDVPAIVYTGTGNFDRCVRAVRLGAYGFIDKSEPMERVVQEIENVLERRRLEGEVEVLKKNLGMGSGLIGTSRPMEQLKEQIARIAPIPSSVLILGESGTGKELVARDLHQQGKDPKAPFVAVNCAALPENLIESELFGHERGAFTGASRTRKGAFQLAADGTIFLDEIGEMPLPAQAKLLRVLEQREITRIGGDRPIKITSRVVAATNRDLEEESSAGHFRSDLYFRLNVHILQVPPLRDRKSDIPELVDHFLTLTCKRFGMRKKRVAPEATQFLMGHDWQRNNVRELRNIVERMVIASDTDVIGTDAVPVEIEGGSVSNDPAPTTYHELKAEAERQIVVSALERNEWHISNTARSLGLADHASLLKIMRRLGVKKA